MKTTRKKIALRRDEDSHLRKLYVQWRVPRGQYRRHPDYLAQFTALWNSLSGRTDTEVDLLHYIDSQQKHKDRLEVPWPTFDGAHRRLEPVANVITADRAKIVSELYRALIIPLDINTDSFCYRTDLVDLLANEFFKRTKIRVPGMLLAAWIEGERKAGRWLTLRDKAFGDLDEIG